MRSVFPSSSTSSVFRISFGAPGRNTLSAWNVEISSRNLVRLVKLGKHSVSFRPLTTVSSCVKWTEVTDVEQNVTWSSPRFVRWTTRWRGAAQWRVVLRRLLLFWARWIILPSLRAAGRLIWEFQNIANRPKQLKWVHAQTDHLWLLAVSLAGSE